MTCEQIFNRNVLDRYEFFDSSIKKKNNIINFDSIFKIRHIFNTSRSKINLLQIGIFNSFVYYAIMDEFLLRNKRNKKG